MDEKQVVGAVRRWLERQEFTVRDEFLLDETGRPATKHRPNQPEAQKRVLGWLRAYPSGVSMVELTKGLSDVVSSEAVREAVQRLAEGEEVFERAGRVVLGVPPSGSLVVPCPLRPDLWGFRGSERIERWSVECKGSRADIAHGLGQAHLYSRVTDRSFLAVPADWPLLYPADQKRSFWTILSRVANDLGFHMLRVEEDGGVLEV